VSAKRVMVACAIAMTVAVTGCGSQLPTVKAASKTQPSKTQPNKTPPSKTPPSKTPPSKPQATSTPWPERWLLPENTRLWNASQVLDPAAGVLYALS
jgi:hypothetical protein